MVADFRMQDQAAVIQWFKPDLGKKRAIECYELQLCRLSGPITVSLSTVTHNNREQTKALGAGLEEFVTLDKNIPTNEYTIYKLKAGDRYKIRVRCKLVDEEWPDWDHSMQSDPFAMPATMPNPPIHIRPFALNSKLTKDAEDGNPETMEGESQAGMDDMDSLQDQSDMTIAQSQASSYYAPEDRVKLTDDLDITHEYITITWTNGDSNGENIIEYNIEMARVRTYNPRDVIFARDAFLGVGTAETEDDYDRNFNYKVTSVESPSKSGKDYASEVIEWEDITKLGTFLAPQVFRAVNLYPGNAYTFRVKQKNKCGWSKISKASPLMCTHPSVPPATLYLLQVKDTFSVICWDEVEYKQSSLTTLEYQIQIRSLYSRLEEGKSKEAQYEKDWEDADARLMQPAELKHYITNSDFMETLMHPRKAGKQSGCMIRNLVELHWYIARVRVRSVIGWSPWSQATESFRTLR